MNTLFEIPFSFKEPVSDSEHLISVVVLTYGSTAWRPGSEENESDTRPCLKRKESSRKLTLHKQNSRTLARLPGSTLTFVQTTSTGRPRLCVSVSAPRGRTTLSSLSSCVAVALRWGEAGKSSPGSTYSWKSLITASPSKHSLGMEYVSLHYFCHNLNLYFLGLDTILDRIRNKKWL